MISYIHRHSHGGCGHIQEYIVKSTILIVDDEHEIREMLMKYLERKGYEVVIAVDGTDALTELDARPGRVDCVITDHDMPNMTGIELLEQMRGNSQHQNVPVILGSARVMEDEDLRAKAEALGARVIMKHYRLNTLMEEVRIALGES